MKTKPNSKILLYCSFFVLASCTSNDQNSNEQSDAAPVSDRIITLKGVPEKVKKAIPPTKPDATDAWVMFKFETEKKIFQNESKLEEIKAIPNANPKSVRVVIRLENANIGLRKLLDEYSDNMKLKCKDFKTLMNQNLMVIETELKELAVSEEVTLSARL